MEPREADLGLAQYFAYGTAWEVSSYNKALCIANQLLYLRGLQSTTHLISFSWHALSEIRSSRNFGQDLN